MQHNNTTRKEPTGVRSSKREIYPEPQAAWRRVHVYHSLCCLRSKVMVLHSLDIYTPWSWHCWIYIEKYRKAIVEFLNTWPPVKHSTKMISVLSEHHLTELSFWIDDILLYKMGDCWHSGSEVMSTYWSHRGPDLNSKHPHHVAHSPWNFSSRGSDTLSELHGHVYSLAHTHTEACNLINMYTI